MFDGIGLTAEQEEAVRHDRGNLLIVAGAGTGKTTTLAARLADLVARGVAPERILLLTFSRRAAAELVARAEAIAGGELAARTWAGTFHAMANRLLRRYGQAIGIDPSFTVLDAADTADLLALVREEQAGEGPPERRRARKETLAEAMSRCVNARERLVDVVRSAYPWCLEEVDEMRAAFRAYTERKRASGVLDYDDLLLMWSALLDEPATGRVLQERFDHVLVDEYQDTNPLQADVLAGMVGGGARITAVGDDAQSIYSFRAATVDNILGFADRFDAEVALLTQSHRSTTPLLQTTNALIGEAARRHAKELWSDRAGTARPLLHRCGDEGEQSRLACQRIIEHLERGVALRRQAVLVRTAYHSDLLEVELTARNIPFVKYGGLRFLEAAHVKDLLAALRVVANPRDALAWFRILRQLESVGPAGARRLAEALVAADDAYGALAGADVPEAARDGARALAAALREAAAATKPAVAIERVRVWLDPAIRLRQRNATARLRDLDQLHQAAAAAPSLARFVSELTLDPPAATGELAGPPSLDEDVLTISTIHSAKGGEWDVVHVIHLADGNVPSDLATGDAEAIEEERRLLYVAMTRARDGLELYAPLRYHRRRHGRDDAHGYAQLSRFLSPAVLAHVDEPRGEARGDDDAPQRTAGGGDAVARVDRAVAALWD